MSLLTVRDLTVRYGGDTAVERLSFDVATGESVCLVGESGSGKSQTAMSILGLLPEDAVVEGSIRFCGQELLHADEAALDAIRARRIAFVFQDPMQALNPFVRVGDQLRRILLRHGLAGAREARGRVIEMLETVGLPDADRQYRAYVHELSGGMRQRVMIAAALITEPELLIADEPTSALDVTVQAQVLELLEEIRHDTALLLITHDLGVVAGHCHRMLVLKDGRLVESGFTRHVFANPQHPHTAALLEAAPRLDRSPSLSPAAGDAVLQAEGIAVSFRDRGRAGLHAVRGVDLGISPGETVAVVGESGSGKSSFARALLGLIPMRAGTVTFCGTRLKGAVQRRAFNTRRDLQLVFQDPAGSLNPRMRVAAIVEEPLSVHEKRVRARERRRRACAMLETLGLGAEYLDRYPHQLSGGQAQRVAIARALILNPKVLVCDEAVAALDGTVREQILEELVRIQRDSGLAIIFIAHDLAVVRAISHRVLVIYMGKVVEAGDNEHVFANPRHPYTRALLAAVPVPDPAAPGGKAAIGDEPTSALRPPPGCLFHPRCAYAIEDCSRLEPGLRRVGSAEVACHRAGDI